MEIQLSINNPKRALALLEFLKASDLIDTFKILDNPVAVSAPVSPEATISFFDRFYGSVPNLDVQAFEKYLIQTRNEWER